MTRPTTNAQTRTIFVLVLSFALLVGGVATALGVNYQREYALRGWADPTQITQTADLPRRIPLAGVNVELTQYDPTTLERELKNIAGAGFTWVRQNFYWSEIEKSQGTFDFSRYDPIVEAVSKQQPLRIVAVLDGTPTWARRPDASDRLTGPPASMAAFGQFAGKLAEHYKDRIDYYQVWDEPNLLTHWGGLDPRPADYAAMLRAGYTAIHGNDLTATVIMAALAPTVETGPHNLSDVIYLRALYDVGAADSFDAVAGKPYGFDSDPEDRTVSQNVLNFSHLILMREEMVRRSDGDKALWGSNFGWNHLPDDWKGPPSIWGQVSAENQRQYTRAAYARAMREWPWMGGLILHHWQPPVAADDPMQGFAISQFAAEWFESGAFFNRPVLSLGLHDPSDPRFSYQGEWRFGPLGADMRKPATDNAPDDGSLHQLAFQFEGDELAFQVRRADYVAYMYITIDGQPANALPRNTRGDAYIQLKSPDLLEHTDLILAGRNLGPGMHQAAVRVYLGYDRWSLAGIAIGNPPDTGRFDNLIVLALIAALVGLGGTALAARELGRNISSGNITAIALYVRRMADILIGIGVSILAAVGMFVTWGDVLPGIFRRDMPTIALTVLTIGLIYYSPSVIITVIALIALWLILYNRPVVGLALVIFWAPFYLMPVQLYRAALPMVEVSLILTVTAVMVRGIVRRKNPDTPRSVSPAEPIDDERARHASPFRNNVAASGGSMRLADLAMLAFVLVATLTLLWSEQRAPALREWRRMVIEPALFFLLLRVVRLSERDIVRLIDVLLFAGLAVAGIGLIFYVQGIEGVGVVLAEQGSRRLASVYGSPNNAALFLGRCVPYAFAMLLIAPGALRRAVAGLVMVILLVATVLTQSGGALLFGVPAGIISVLILWNRRRGLIVAGAVGLLLIALTPFVIPRLQGALALTRASSFVRTQVWASTISLLRERPLTGAGIDQFLYLYRSRYILPEAWREPDLSHPHNIILDYWVTLGILGLAILIALQLGFWRSALAAWRRWRERDPLLAAVAVGAMGSMAAFLAHGIVDNSYFVVDLAYVFCLTLAIVIRLENLVQVKQNQP